MTDFLIEGGLCDFYFETKHGVRIYEGPCGRSIKYLDKGWLLREGLPEKLIDEVLKTVKESNGT